MKKVLFVFGTRPEAIKMAPLIKKFQCCPDVFNTVVCVTGQHRQMLDQILEFFNITTDYDLNIMKSNQSLFNITMDALGGLEDVLKETNPDLIFVQGDTSTAFVGALAGYYKQIQVAHLEAGLRSFNKYSPFPEEVNRKLIGNIADYHFAPTQGAKDNLNKENIHDNVYVVGNTVVDALFLGLDIIKERDEDIFHTTFKYIDFSKKIILVTGHRRESFGAPFENICNALKEIVTNHKDVEIVYPVHFNPNVRESVNSILRNTGGVHLVDPLDYPYLLWLMEKSYIVLTDSGGIQEEAPSLGKPVLVMRDVTERMEGVNAGTAKLVGTDRSEIIKETEVLLNNEKEYARMAKANNPYGDGKTSEYVYNIISKELGDIH